MRNFIVIVFWTFCFVQLYGQTASQPLELPNFIIEGKEQIDVQIGTKQTPFFPTYLSRGTIDSLIVVEKPRNYIIFPVKFPETVIARKFPSGYLSGSLGSFLTGNLNFGYSINYHDYDIFTFGDINASRGHLENAGYMKIKLGAQSEYLAPDKFYIFGGSKTTTNLELDYRNYKLYAINTAPKRSQLDFGANVTSVGNFEGFDFRTGGRLDIFHQGGGGKDLNENTIGGFLEVQNSYIRNQYGGRVSVDFRSFEGNSANFFEIAGFYKFEINQVDIKPEIGLQLAHSSKGNNEPMVLVGLLIEKNINENLAVFGGFSNRLKNKSFHNFAFENPYLSDSTYLDYTNFTEISGNLKFQPTKDFTTTFGTKFIYAKRYPVFLNSSSETFKLDYLDATFFEIYAEGYRIVPSVGDFSGRIDLDISTLTGNKNEVPYTPMLKVRFDYRRKFFEKVFLNAFAEYIGKRYADAENRVQLDAYNNLGLLVEYSISNLWFASFEIQNLLNSNVMVWNNYKERGLNFKFNLTYKF